MSLSDPIADMLTRIRNASRVGRDTVNVKASKVCQGVAQVLKDEGFIEDFEVVEHPPQDLIRVYLRYNDEGIPAARLLKRVSKPGRRVYRGADEIKPVLNGLGVSIVSTSRGLLTDRQAREQRIGGEILCELW